MPLNHDLLPMREFHKAKRLHWDPQAIDIAPDRADWAALDPRDQEGIWSLCTLFLVGESAVTHDLAPLLVGLRQRGGRLEDELFLTAQLYEEAKHTEFFDRWLGEVIGPRDDAPDWTTPSYRALFLERLPATLHACLHDPSARTIAIASGTYHLIIEGVMAETGYEIFARSARQRGIFPGLLDGVRHIQQDEGRHIAYGLYLLQSLIAEEPSLWPDLVASLNEGLMLATAALSEAFGRWGDQIPFGLDPNEMVGYAAHQYRKRFDRLQPA